MIHSAVNKKWCLVTEKQMPKGIIVILRISSSFPDNDLFLIDPNLHIFIRALPSYVCYIISWGMTIFGEDFRYEAHQALNLTKLTLIVDD